MFGDSVYQAQTTRVEPEDRLLIASDGVYATLSPDGEPFEKSGLARTIRATRLLRPAQVPGAILRELTEYHGGVPQDDAVIVCIDWHGRPAAIATS